MAPASQAPIKASFAWTAQEFLLCQKVCMRHWPLRRNTARKSVVAGSLTVVFGAIIIIIHGFRSAGPLFVIGGLVLLAFPLIIKRVNLRHYYRRPDHDKLVQWEFTEDALHCQVEGSSSNTRWNMIAKVLRTPDGFLLYPNDRVFHWVPVSAFRDADAITAFAQLARSKSEYSEAS